MLETKFCSNPALILVTITLTIAFILSLIPLITQHWAHSEVHMSVGVRLEIRLGLFDENCEVHKEKESLVMNIIGLFISIDDMCEEQIKDRPGYVGTTSALLITAVVVLTITLIISCIGQLSGCVRFPMWYMVATIPFLLLITIILQICALIVFITQAQAEKEGKIKGLVTEIHGRQGYSMIVAFITPAILILALVLSVFGTWSAMKSYKRLNAITPITPIHQRDMLNTQNTRSTGFTHNREPKRSHADIAVIHP